MPKLRPPTRTEPDEPCDLATVAILYRQPEAAVVLATMRAHGIVAFAADWALATLYPQYTVLLGGIAVRVAAADFARAATILAEIGPLPPPPRNFRCPRWLDVALHALIVVSMFTTGAYFPMPPRARGSYAQAATPV